MPRPANKKELLELSELNFNKLLEFIDGLPDNIKDGTYENDVLNERDKTIADVICHLHEWHLMMETWYKVGMSGKKPDIPAEGYTLIYLEKDGVIRFLYRQETYNDQDSGWRMFTGLEDDDYANDPENIKLINIGYLLDKDPSLLEPLKNGYGAVFEREDTKTKWEKVEDWEPED